MVFGRRKRCVIGAPLGLWVIVKSLEAPYLAPNIFWRCWFYEFFGGKNIVGIFSPSLMKATICHFGHGELASQMSKRHSISWNDVLTAFSIFLICFFSKILFLKIICGEPWQSPCVSIFPKHFAFVSFLRVHGTFSSNLTQPRLLPLVFKSLQKDNGFVLFRSLHVSRFSKSDLLKAVTLHMQYVQLCSEKLHSYIFKFSVCKCKLAWKTGFGCECTMQLQ